MKKSLLGILLLTPVIWGIMTWIASNKTEDVFNNMLTQSQQRINETAPMLTIERQSFSKGFISSNAKSIIRINPDLFDYDEPFKVTLNHVIYHGPLMLTSDGIKFGTSYIKTTLDQNPIEEKTKAAIELIFSGKQPFISNTLTSYNNNITETFDIPKLHIDTNTLEFLQDDDAHYIIDLTGISAELMTNPEASYLEGFMTTGALNITGTDGSERFKLVAHKSVTQLDIEQLYHGAILVGSATFKLPEIIVSNDQQNISIKDISIKTSGNEQDELYNQAISIDIDKLVVNTNSASSILPESKIHISFNLKGLDKTATKHLIDASQTLSETQASLLSHDSAQSQQQLDADISNYLEAISKLANPGLTNNIVFELSNDKGKADLHFDLAYVSSQKLLELKTVKDLIFALSAKLRVSIDKNLVAGTVMEQLLSSPIPNNPLIDNGNAYTAHMTLDNGQLILNDKPIPLLDMLGPSANEPLDWDQYLH